jgi:hypothetical protein
MFLNYTKDFILKKLIKKSLKNLETNYSANSIKKIGLLVDSNSFFETEKLIQELIANGILLKNITTIIYFVENKNIEKPNFISFTGSQLSWNGKLTGLEINDFIIQKFDLLINYYDIEKAILLKITHKSNALFKVGFSSIDNRFNHFLITTTIENYVTFTKELFKYLKLLNKL